MALAALVWAWSHAAGAQGVRVPEITTVAGNGTCGFNGDNGPATSAEICVPQGVATDSAGNVYFADFHNNRIREVNVATGIITTFAGNGSSVFSGDNGPATSAAISLPRDVAVDRAGNVYILDFDNARIREVNASTGIITTVAGNGTNGSGGDGGPATSAQLNSPEGIAVDSHGNLYIADTLGNEIREVNAATGIITTVAGNGTAAFSGDNGAATSAAINFPAGVAVDSAGNIYIADTDNERIREVNASTGIITTVAGNGTIGVGGDGGPATSASLNQPVRVTVDSAGILYISDSSNNRVRQVNPLTKVISTVAGASAVPAFSGDGGPAASAALDGPVGVATDRAGNVYFADAGNARIRKVEPATGSALFATTPVKSSSASRNVLVQLTADQTVVSITANASQSGAQEYTVGAVTGCSGAPNTAGTICIVPVTFSPAFPGERDVPLKVLTNTGAFFVGLSGIGTGPQAALIPGTINSVAGTLGTPGYIGDGGPATAALLSGPHGVAVDSAGNFHIADSFNNQIREVNASTGIITTVAGNGGSANSGDGGPATSAQLQPIAVAVDSAGNLYIADSIASVIREVSASTGLITTVAGSGTNGFSGDGGAATSAQLEDPNGVAVDSAGNLYISDNFNSVVRKVYASNGIITTVAGTPGSAGFSGDNGPATSAQMKNNDVAVDTAGNLYITETSNQRIRKVNASTGIITTVAGNGTVGFSGDGGPATSAQLHSPRRAAVDSAGNLYIVDGGNRIREVFASTGIITTVAGDGNAPPSSGDGGAATSANVFSPDAIAVDSAGNLYIATDDAIREVNVNALHLSFAATNVGSTSADSPQSVLLENIGNTPLTIEVPVAGANPSVSANFALDASTTCPQLTTSSSAAMLGSGADCLMGINFKPTTVGGINGQVVVTQNNLNAAGPNFGMLSIGLSGTGTQISQTITFNNPGTKLQGGTFALSATATSGLTVTFASKTPLVCTVSGSTASLIAPGMCTIEASQSGNAQYSAATPVDQTFSVTAVFILTVNPSLTGSSAPGTKPVVLTLTSVNGFTGPVTLSCILPAGLPGAAKCPGLPVTVKLMPGATVVHDTGVQFPSNTKPGSYVVTFTGVDGRFNNSTTATFNIN